jgi:hypothetical protein
MAEKPGEQGLNIEMCHIASLSQVGIRFDGF